MTTDRSNSAAELNALLAKAKQHATNAKRHDAEETTARQMKIVEWARCADEIEAAIEAAKADGWKLTYAEIARYMAWEAPDSVGAIRRWRRRNPGNPEVITSGPWKDGRSSDQRSAAVRHSNALKVALEEPEVLAERVAKDRSAACLLIRELQKHLKDSRRQPPEEPSSLLWTPSQSFGTKIVSAWATTPWSSETPELPTRSSSWHQQRGYHS